VGVQGGGERHDPFGAQDAAMNGAATSHVDPPSLPLLHMQCSVRHRGVHPSGRFGLVVRRACVVVVVVGVMLYAA
jgi:hypothetical protein